MAEAKLGGRPFADVWYAAESEEDVRGALNACSIAGVPHARVFADAEVVATEVVEHPDGWRAINALADALPPVGRMQGRLASQIVIAALGSSADEILPVLAKVA